MNILITGDSLALPRPHRINNYKLEEELAVHFHDTYGYLVQAALQNKFPDKMITVTNRAQRAATIKDIHREGGNHIFFFQPDVLIVQVGIVDCWIRPELEQLQYVKLPEFIRYYLELIQMIKQRPKMKVIFIGICPTSEKMEGRTPGLLSEIMKYNLALKSRVDNEQIFFIDMDEHVSSKDPHRYLLPDDHHLNKAGNALVADKIVNIIFSFTNG